MAKVGCSTSVHLPGLVYPSTQTEWWMWRVLYPRLFAWRPVNVYGLMRMEWWLWRLLHPRPFSWSSVPLRRKQNGGCGECSTPVCLPGGLLTFTDSCEWSGGCGGCSAPVRFPGLAYPFDANRVVDAESALPPSVCLEAC